MAADLHNSGRPEERPVVTAPMTDAEIEALLMPFTTGMRAYVGEFVDDQERALYQLAATNHNAKLQVIAELKRVRAESERRRVRLLHADNDLLEVRGLLSPNGYPQRVPIISEAVAPAVEWLLAENEKLRAQLAAKEADRG